MDEVSLVIIVLFVLLMLWSLAGFILSVVSFFLGVKADSMVFSLFKTMGSMNGPMGRPMAGPMGGSFNGEIDRKQEREMMKSMSPEERAMYKRNKKAVKKIMENPLHFLYEIPFHVNAVEFLDDHMRLELYSSHYKMNLGVITKSQVKCKPGDIFLCRMSDSPDTDVYGPLEGDIEINGVLQQTKRCQYLFVSNEKLSDGTACCYSIVTENPVEMMKRVEQNKRYFIVLAHMTEDELKEHDQMMTRRAEELNKAAGGRAEFGYDTGDEDEFEEPVEA